jgi:hypothetical protein
MRWRWAERNESHRIGRRLRASQRRIAHLETAERQREWNAAALFGGKVGAQSAV